MRNIKTMLTAIGMILMPAAAALAQDSLKVNISTSETRTTTWYTDPVWLAVGGLAVLLIIVLIVMAARGKGSSTTVVR